MIYIKISYKLKLTIFMIIKLNLVKCNMNITEGIVRALWRLNMIHPIKKDQALF